MDVAFTYEYVYMPIHVYVYACIFLCSTGVWVPHIPKIEGIDYAEVRITVCVCVSFQCV